MKNSKKKDDKEKIIARYMVKVCYSQLRALLKPIYIYSFYFWLCGVFFAVAASRGCSLVAAHRLLVCSTGFSVRT